MIHDIRWPPALEASIWVDDGIAVTSLRSDGTELLGRPGPEDVFTREDVPLGVTLLYPWANRLATDSFTIGTRRADVGAIGESALRDRAGLPIHGFAGRDPGWRVTYADSERLTAKRRWDKDGPRWLAFPVQHVTWVAIQVAGRALTICTSIIATGDEAVPVAFGWHPYLAPPDSTRADWTLGLPEAQRVGLDPKGIPSHPLPWQPAACRRLAQHPYDHAFAVADQTRACVRSREWNLTVRLDAGYRYLQIYAPHDRNVACLEPMTAPTNALVSGSRLPYARPGAPFVARFALHVERVVPPAPP